MKFVEQRYEKGFWLMSSLTALFVIFSLMLFLYNEYERDRLSGNFWLVSFKISYLCLPLFYETRTTPSCHPSGCAYRQL